MSVVELFCDVDDFVLALHKEANRRKVGTLKKRGRKCQMCLSEVLTILILFHQSGYRCFKWFYIERVLKQMHSEFPKAVSYNRFVELTPGALIPLCLYLRTLLGTCTGISFIDSTPLTVCHNRRIQRHRTFKEQAGRGKTSMGWFYGFKLHIVVNDRGELLSFVVTAGNFDDRRPVPKLATDLWGKLFGDKGYISKALTTELYKQGTQLITPLRKNMQNKLMLLEDKLLQRKRSIIETINDQLKNISQIDHTRHRSVFNFATNLIAGLIAYCLRPKKPSLNINHNGSEALAIVM